MKRYDVTGKLYLSEEQYQKLLQKGDYTHVKMTGEQEQAPIAPEDLKYDNSWVAIRHSFPSKRDAIDYADKVTLSGVSGSFADVTKATDFLWTHTRMLIYSVRKGGV